MIEWFVPGHPAQQGSKRHIGHGIMIESNPKLKSWRTLIAQTAPITEPYLTAVKLTVQFMYLRPKSHYGRRDGLPYLKPTAPYFKTSAADLDKLVRAVNDSLTGIAFRDDAQVACIVASKTYTEEQEGVHITLEPC
jgi:crossover junction endodeoxyribonuclease RusA